MPGNLIYYALVLIVIALVAALLGFGGLASTAMGGAHLLIWVAVVVLIIGVVFAFVRRSLIRPPHARGPASRLSIRFCLCSEARLGALAGHPCGRSRKFSAPPPGY